MTSIYSVGHTPLRLVHRRPVSSEAEVADFYDRTITAVWRLALSLHPTDARRASDTVVEAYRTVWSAGPAARTQAALLHALVTGAREEDHGPVPA